MADIHPPRWEAGALIVHKNHVRDMQDQLPPQVEMRVRSIDTNADYRVLPMSVRFERGDGPYQVAAHDLEHIIDWLREHGYPALAGPDDPDVPRDDEQARRDRAVRRVLAVLQANFSRELHDVPLGIAMVACLQIVETVLDEDHDPLRSP